MPNSAIGTAATWRSSIHRGAGALYLVNWFLVNPASFNPFYPILLKLSSPPHIFRTSLLVSKPYPCSYLFLFWSSPSRQTNCHSHRTRRPYVHQCCSPCFIGYSHSLSLSVASHLTVVLRTDALLAHSRSGLDNLHLPRSIARCLLMLSFAAAFFTAPVPVCGLL